MWETPGSSHYVRHVRDKYALGNRKSCVDHVPSVSLAAACIPLGSLGHCVEVVNDDYLVVAVHDGQAPAGGPPRFHVVERDKDKVIPPT